MANLQKESRKLEEKQIVWERVLAKLEDKFQGRLEQTEGIVNGWYQSVVEQELAEVCAARRWFIKTNIDLTPGRPADQGGEGRCGPWTG